MRRESLQRFQQGKRFSDNVHSEVNIAKQPENFYNTSLTDGPIIQYVKHFYRINGTENFLPFTLQVCIWHLMERF